MKVLAVAVLLLAGCVAPVPQAVQVAPLPLPVPVVQPRPLPPQLAGLPAQGGLVRGQVSPGVTALTLDDRAVPIAPDGSFLIGFDRDAGPQARLVQRHASGAEVVPLTVAPRVWAIERVNTPYRAGKTNAAFEAARPAELAAIAAARAMSTGAQGWRQPLRWPVIGRISGQFGAQRIYQGRPGSFHSGTDIAVPGGTPVLAPADGIVILATDHPFTLEGNLLMLDHGMGLNSALLHLSRIGVRVGDRVRQGQAIGAVGATGRATGPHLHWSLQWLGARLDPPAAVAEPMTRFPGRR